LNNHITDEVEVKEIQVENSSDQQRLLLSIELESLDIVKDHMSRPDQWTRHPAGFGFSFVTETNQHHHLLAGALKGQGKLLIPPAIFSSIDGLQIDSVLHLGSDMCGHPGIIHGGLIATILDEITAMTVSLFF